MKLAKKGFLFLLCCLLLASCALADVLWEPINDYYWEHSDAFTYDGGAYFLNGHDGYVVLYDEPGGKPVRGFENGEQFWISWTIEQGGDNWGVVEQDDYSGYVRMDEMLRVYDSEQFLRDHEAELTETLDVIPKLPDGTIVWTYPHSGTDDGTLNFSDGMDQPQFSTFYTDDEGLQWGYCGYHYGWHELWICLSDPTNPALSVTQIDYPDKIPPQPVPAKLPNGGTNATLWIAVALVAGVVLVTAVLLIRFKKPKNM